MRKKFTIHSGRRRRNLLNITKQKKSFPETILRVIELSDIILEVFDARFVHETRNIEMEKLIKEQSKKIIYVFNKSDLLKKQGMEDVRFFDMTPKVFVSCTKRIGTKNLRNLIKIEASKISNPVDIGIKGRVTVGIIGYPNTGKSSLINLLIGRGSAKTASEAGLTKSIQKLRLTSDIVLLDSPGVIPEKEYSMVKSQRIIKHAKLNARTYNNVKDPWMAVMEIMKEFPLVLDNFYKIDSNGNSDDLLENLGRKKGFLRKGGEVDEDRTARLILKDWQEGKIKF